MTEFIHDTWSEDWIDIDSVPLMHPETVAQLWRCYNTKRTTMNKSFTYPYNLTLPMFTVAADAFPDGTDPADVVDNRTLTQVQTNFIALRNVMRSSLLIDSIISSLVYKWASGTEESYTYVTAPIALSDAKLRVLEDWRESVITMRNFLDQLDLLVSEGTITWGLSGTASIRYWVRPSARTVAIPRTRLEVNYINWAPADAGACCVYSDSDLAVTSEYYYIDSRNFTLYDLIGYSDIERDVSDRYDYAGIYYTTSQEVTYYVQVDDPEIIKYIIDSPATAATISEINDPDVDYTNSGNYETDGGELVSTDTNPTSSPRNVLSVTYASYTGDSTTTYTLSGYLNGHITGYTVEAGPVMPTVTIGSYDPILDRTFVTITTPAITSGSAAWTATPTNVPTNVRTHVYGRYSDPIDTEVGIRSIIAPPYYEYVHRYVHNNVDEEVYTITEDSYTDYAWATGISGSYKVNFTT